MARTSAQIIVELIDKASGPARQVAKALREIRKAGEGRGFRDLGTSSGMVTARLGQQATAAHRVSVAVSSMTAPVRKASQVMEQAARPARTLAEAHDAVARGANRSAAAVERSARAEARLVPIRERAQRQARREAIRARREGGGGIGIADRVLAGSTGIGVGTLGAAGGAYMVGAQLRKATRSAMSFEDTLIEVGKATDSKGAELDAYATSLMKLARATGKTKQDLGAMLAAAGFAGRPAQELMQFTEYAAKATVAWGTSAEDTGQALAEIGNIYDANQKRIEEIGDAINTMADSSASKESDLLEFIRRAGASAKGAGMSAESILAFGAAMKEVGVRTDVAATGFEALLNVMKLGEEFSKNAGDGLKELGINSTKMRKAFVAKPVETMVDLLERLNKVADPLKKAEIMTNLFGKEYQDDIAKLLNGLPKINQYLALMQNKAKIAGSVRLQFAEGMERDTNKIRQAEQAIDALYLKIGNPVKVRLGEMADGFNKLFDDLDSRAGIFERMAAEREAYLKNAGKLPDLPLQPESREGSDVMAPLRRKHLDFQDWLYGKAGKAEEELDAARKAGQERAEREVLSAPGQIENQVRRQRAEAERNRSMAPRLTGRQQTMARDAASRTEAEVTRLEGELAKAQDAALAVRARRASETRRRLGAFGLNGAEGEQTGITPGSFGLGMNGTGNLAPRNVPMPPARPADLGGIKAMGEAADQAKQKLSGLSEVTVAPKADTSGLQSLNSLCDQVLGKLARIGSASARAEANGRALVASLDRSKQTSMTSSPV